MAKLTGKVAVVTGASKGIGAEIARHMAAEGASVIVNYSSSPKEADEVVRSALPGEMYNVFMHYKRDEWERYCATVTDWDVNEYLDVLP